MALLLYNCVLFLALFLWAPAAIDLNSACGGELSSSHTECLFAGHGIYAARHRSAEITSIGFDSLRNSAISLRNLPNVQVLEIASKPFDTYEACEHLKDQLQPVTVKLENTITVCVSRIFLPLCILHSEPVFDMHVFPVLLIKIVSKLQRCV